MKRRRPGGMRFAAMALIVATLMLVAGHAAAPPPGPALDCATDQGLLPAGKALPHFAAALRDGRPLDVVAVGPATMLGPHMGVPDSFPARTVQMLRDARPGWDIRLISQAERGASTVALLAILRRFIAAHPGALVLWQAGTVEAATRRPPAELATTLGEGVRAAVSAGSDIILIDPPYSRLLSQRVDLDRYDPAFLAAATAPGAALFSRYAVTRRWVESGQIDLERAPPGQRAATLARLHECLARVLARGLLAAGRVQAASTASR